MYAELNEFDELVAGEPVKLWYRSASFQYVVDGFTYTAPANWFTAWDTAQKAATHIFPMTANTWDTDRYQQSGDPITYTFDGSLVSQIIPTMAKAEPESLNQYKVKADRIIDGEGDSRIAAAEDTPAIGVDYTENSAGHDRANKKRNNKAKKKNNTISDADDHLYDHIDLVYDAAEQLRDAVEAAADYDAVDVITADVANDTHWPIWTPI